MVAQAAGVSLRAVQRIWQANRLQPHRIRTFKTSRDPAFAAKVEDVVGLYMNPPVHAVVVSIDEKSQIQALDRTQPGLPMKPGKCGTMTHDYKRNGTTTLFAALNILDGTVVGRCMPSHTHKEFIKFLNAVERAVRPGRIIHAIADNYATHKHQRSRGGSPITRAGCFISPPPPHPGSTPSKVSSQPSPADKSDAVSSNPSPTSRTPSAATSTSTTDPQNRSSGPNQPTPSSPSSPGSLYLLNEPVH